MHVRVELNLQLKVEQGSLRRFLREPLYEPLQLKLKALDLLAARESVPTDRQGDVHRYEAMHHLLRSGSGSWGNPLR